MATANIVDELIVQLKLDTSAYRKADKEVDKLTGNSERKLKRTDEARNKRMKQSSVLVTQLATAMRGLATTIGTVLGVGTGAAGLVAAVVSLTNFETGLRRAAVSTGLSNREMQAWGSAARRLGADAEAGRAAIAELAKEQKQFHLTGNAPTMQAFARMGIQVSPDTPIADILANAQRVYRGSTKAQQGQIESGLAASGVSNDLILLIKSEKDVRAEFARSYAESATENRKALDSVTNALEAAKNSAISVANAIATLLQPQIEQFGQWLSKGAAQVSAFVDKVIAAGGGVEGLIKVLDTEAPELARLLRLLGTGVTFLGEVVDVAVLGYKKLGAAIKEIYDWVDQKISGALGVPGAVKGAVAGVGEFVKGVWREVVNEARGTPSAGGARAPAAAGAARPGGGAAPAAGTGAPPSAGKSAAATAAGTGKQSQDAVMRGLLARGFTVDQAAGIASNIKHESGYNTTAVNREGGGIGAHGLFQWRGTRARAFQARYGKLPSQATLDEQLDFFASDDPEERRSRQAALAGGGSAFRIGQAVSAKYERHGNVAEDIRRGQDAAKIAQQYQNGQGAGPQIAINGPVTVQANNPQELVGGIQRVSGAGNFNSAVR